MSRGRNRGEEKTREGNKNDDGAGERRGAADKGNKTGRTQAAENVKRGWRAGAEGGSTGCEIERQEDGAMVGRHSGETGKRGRA